MRWLFSNPRRFCRYSNDPLLYGFLSLLSVLIIFLILILFNGCSKDSSSTSPSEADTTDNTPPDDQPFTGMLWDGLELTAWLDPVEIKGDTVKLDGTSVIYTTQVIDVQQVELAILKCTLHLNGSLNNRSLTTETCVYGHTSFGVNWTGFKDTLLTTNDENLLLTVFDDSWRLNENPIDSIKVKFKGFSPGGYSIDLLNPVIVAEKR